MIWTAWNNGSHHTTGAGYGLKVPIPDRDAHMARAMESIVLEVPSDAGTTPIRFNIDKDSFWSPSCHELISRQFGEWLISRQLAPWPRGRPPRFEISLISRGVFELRRMVAA